MKLLASSVLFIAGLYSNESKLVPEEHGHFSVSRIYSQANRAPSQHGNIRNLHGYRRGGQYRDIPWYECSLRHLWDECIA